MNGVNLIPARRLARAGAARRKRAWWRFIRVYLILAALGAGGALVPVYAAGPSLDGEIARMNKRIEMATQKRDEIQKKNTTLAQKVGAAKAVGEHPDWSLVLDTVSRLRAGDIALESAELSIQKQDVPTKPGAPAPGPATANHTQNAPKTKPQETFVLRVAGYSSAPGGVLSFIQRLEGLNLFERVSLKNTHAQALGQMPATHFEIEMLLPNPPPGVN